MAKSDDYIDFKAYIRYLGKVSCEPADPEAMKKRILGKTAGQTEMHTAYVIMKRVVVAAAAVLIVALGSALYGYLSDGEVLPEENLWSESRLKNVPERNPAFRLYEAYRHSSEIRDGFLK